METERLRIYRNIDNSLWYVKDETRTLSPGFKFESGAKIFADGYATGWNDCQAHVMDRVESLKKRSGK
jgi:hypothetical protein